MLIPRIQNLQKKKQQKTSKQKLERTWVEFFDFVVNP
jgi:hypothetical protein